MLVETELSTFGKELKVSESNGFVDQALAFIVRITLNTIVHVGEVWRSFILAIC